jgi:5-methylcytosine-specific restriction endonuclease McrA
MPQQSRDKYLGILSDAMSSLAGGNQDQADYFSNLLSTELPPLRRRRAFSRGISVAVFRRDKFTCRYCGTSVVPSPIPRAASLLWPQQIPYHPNWRSDSTHPIYAARTATIDHIEPHAKGGLHEGIDNFATACWPCNTQKSDLSLDEIGWDLHDVFDTQWDGLVCFYPMLWSAAKAVATESDIRFHTPWLAAFA